MTPRSMLHRQDDGSGTDPLVVLLPLLIILSTLLLLLLIFLVCILVLRRRRSIVLKDNDGPVDLSREEFVSGDGGFEVIESRWMESVAEPERQSYRRAQAFQTQYPPNSQPTDITLSQFLSIQEKGVSAWSFDPDYETSPNVLVHARTELTFLPDPSSASSVQSNLPLPKLNEVYYWEVKMFDLPVGTNVSIGLATKPYPTFRLPGHSRHSIGYHSNGDKSYNYPFTAMSYGPSLKEGDVLGIGFRPRTGAVFFTRNGRKLDDAFTGLSRWNLFPTVGADGPCSVHVNLGQSGFVHIEANVKKWGLAPSVGTLAPPPAYGSERGSILLAAGGETPVTSTSLVDMVASNRQAAIASSRLRAGQAGSSNSAHSSPPRRTRMTRRPKNPALSSSVPATPSPLRGGAGPSTSAIQADDEESPDVPQAPSERYISPTDAAYHGPADLRLPPPTPSDESVSDAEDRLDSSQSSRRQVGSDDEGEETPLIRPGRDDDATEGDETEIIGDPESPQPHNPPTPHVSDIRLRTLNATTSSHSRGSSIHGLPLGSIGRGAISLIESPASTHNRSQSAPINNVSGHLRRPPTDESAPPAYSPLNPHTYPDGVAIDLPAEVIAAALEGPTPAQRAAEESRTRQ